MTLKNTNVGIPGVAMAYEPNVGPCPWTRKGTGCHGDQDVTTGPGVWPHRFSPEQEAADASVSQLTVRRCWHFGGTGLVVMVVLLVASGLSSGTSTHSPGTAGFVLPSLSFLLWVVVRTR